MLERSTALNGLYIPLPSFNKVQNKINKMNIQTKFGTFRNIKNILLMNCECSRPNKHEYVKCVLILADRIRFNWY